MEPPAETGAPRGGGLRGRFLISGAANTGATYAAYLLLLDTAGHRLAYSLAFGMGIVLAYALNRGFVFRRHAGLRSALATPAIYALQYLLGLAMVELWSAFLGWPKALAPLAAIAVTLPLTYLLSKAAFAPR